MLVTFSSDFIGVSEELEAGLGVTLLELLFRQSHVDPCEMVARLAVHRSGSVATQPVSFLSRQSVEELEVGGRFTEFPWKTNKINSLSMNESR